MYYCITTSFTSIFEKHLTSLSLNEYNAKETMRVLCITNRVDLKVSIVHSGHFVTLLPVRIFALKCNTQVTLSCDIILMFIFPKRFINIYTTLTSSPNYEKFFNFPFFSCPTAFQRKNAM